MPDHEARRDEIVASAIALLDDEGFDGLTMRKLARRTGASATSVYWYVQGREELVALALDVVIEEVPLPAVAAGGWRAAAEAMARDFRAMVQRHPWLVVVAANHPSASGPRLLRHNDHALGVYEAAGFSPGGAEHAVQSVYAYLIGSAAARDPDPAALDAARAATAGLPRMLARLDALERGDPDAGADAAFDFGLAAMLDGLVAQLAAGAGAGPGAAVRAS